MSKALKSLIAIAGILATGLMVAGAEDSTNFVGRWELVFQFLRDTGNPNAPVRPWRTFDAEFRQEGDRLVGSITARGSNAQGTFNGAMTADGLVGTLRFPWDDHEWQLFTLRLSDGTDAGEGIAVFAPRPKPDLVRHVYSVRCQRMK